MKHATKAFLIFAGLGLSACANVETATRNAPFEATPPAHVEVDTSVTRTALTDEAPLAIAREPLRISSYSVVVPRELRVSEANLFYPTGDIVWRGDALGDRHQQVAAIFETGLQRSAGLMNAGRPANVQVEVMRFHSLTEKARYTTGGVHSIKFKIAATDPETGAVLMAPRVIKADLKAFGGAKAIAAERQGHDQKFRITNHLIKVLHQELTGDLPPMVAAATLTAPETPATAQGQIKLN